MKNNFSLRHLLLFLVVFILFISFQLPDSVDQSKIPLMVKNKLDEEVRNYYEDRMKICKLDALTRAEDYVDSIIENKIQLVIAKGVIFPLKPTKPNFPKEIKINDSTKIQPVLKKDN